MDHKRIFCTIAALAVACLGFTAAVRADETCNSPYMSRLIKGQEDYVYVWALGVQGMGDGSDKLVTVDVNPKS
jgi:selenium-binding protein 1